MRLWVYQLFLTIQVIGLIYVYKEGKNGLQSVHTLQHEVEQVAQQVTERNKEIAALQNEIVSWKTYPFYKEKIAREHLHMARKGDVVYYHTKGI